MRIKNLNTPVHKQILAQCLQTPDAIAITWAEFSITYGELRKGIMAVACSLKEIAREGVIGLYLSRSIDFIVAALGTLEAGCSYLPLNPNLPAERLAFMIEDADVQAMIFNVPLPAHWSIDSKVKVLSWDEITAVMPSEEVPVRESEDLNARAYVIYTSGSTGKPKGVEVLQRNLLSFQQAILQSPGVSAKDVVVSVASFSFDMSGFDIYPVLATGGQLVIATESETQDGRLLARLIDRVGATLLKSTPATWHLLLQSGWNGKRGLRLVSGGDLLTWSLAKSLFERVDALWNVYGPTEATVHCAEFLVSDIDRKDCLSVPIGKPLPRCELYLLDSDGKPVVEGEAGEIYIAGAQVARGYLNRPELTNERFVIDPWHPGQSMYRTGDRARRLAEGHLEFLGRHDFQVKLRGYRIELQEISLTLQQHPAVQEAVVVIREDREGDQRLVAYLTQTAPEFPLWANELNAFLLKKIPAYMIPSSYVVLKKIPLNTSGKPDRSQFPKPEEALLAQDYEALQQAEHENALHKEIAGGMGIAIMKIWGDLLGRQPPSLYDDFFNLGGHSLLAMRMLNLLEETFGVPLSLAALYPKATIANLTLQILEKQYKRASYQLVELRPHGHKPPLFLVHPVSGQIAIFADLILGLEPDQPVYAFESVVQYPEEQPSIEELAATYIALLKQKQPQGPYYLAGPSMGGWVAFEMALQLTQQGDEVALLVEIDSAPKIRLTTLAMGESPILDEAQYLAAAVMTLRGHAGGIQAVQKSKEDFGAPLIRSLSSQERWQLAVELLREDHIVGEDFPEAQLRRMLRTLMAHTRAFYRYQLTQTGHFPLGVIVNSHPSQVPYKVWGCKNDDSVWGWSHWTSGTVDGPHVISGGDDHWSMLRRKSSLQQVAVVLQTMLNNRNKLGK